MFDPPLEEEQKMFVEVNSKKATVVLSGVTSPGNLIQPSGEKSGDIALPSVDIVIVTKPPGEDGIETIYTRFARYMNNMQIPQDEFCSRMHLYLTSDEFHDCFSRVGFQCTGYEIK